MLFRSAAPEKAAAALIDKDSAVELYAGFGKHVYTAFATIGGNAVGVVATGETLCHNCCLLYTSQQREFHPGFRGH